MNKKLEEKFNKQDAPIDGLLLSFDKYIQYDYEIPDMYRTIKAIRGAIKAAEIPAKERKFFEKLINIEYKGDCSEVEMYIRDNDDRFGSEFFYGYGTLHRWRPNEKQMAIDRVEKYLTESQKKALHIIQNHVSLLIIQGENKIEING